jgi:hypothetical protein
MSREAKHQVDQERPGLPGTWTLRLEMRDGFGFLNTRQCLHDIKELRGVPKFPECKGREVEVWSAAGLTIAKDSGNARGMTKVNNFMKDFRFHRRPRFGDPP